MNIADMNLFIDRRIIKSRGANWFYNEIGESRFRCIDHVEKFQDGYIMHPYCLDSDDFAEFVKAAKEHMYDVRVIGFSPYDPYALQIVVQKSGRQKEKRIEY